MHEMFLLARQSTHTRLLLPSTLHHTATGHVAKPYCRFFLLLPQAAHPLLLLLDCFLCAMVVLA